MALLLPHTSRPSLKKQNGKGYKYGRNDLTSRFDCATAGRTCRHFWIDYDEQADVLYISFRKPQQANDSVMEEEDFIYHYHDSDVVGITVLNASAKA